MQCFVRKLQAQDRNIKKNFKEQDTCFATYFICQKTVKELDLKMVLANPLASVLLTFAHIDGLKKSTANQIFAVSSR